jgi:hypothetical protein
MLQAAPEHRICRPVSPHPGRGNLRQIGGSRMRAVTSDRDAALPLSKSVSDLAEYELL